jgi:peptidoglycan/xylan/chitin deacetylase (PgdA/CDA1 family)
VSDALVLNYHAVSATWPAALSVDPRKLEQQLSIVIGRGYEPVAASSLREAPNARRTLTVTFDDGYRSVLDLAAPVLERLGIAGTVFVVTDFIGKSEPMSWRGVDHWMGTPHEHELASLDWDGIARLVAARWEIGSHTRSHPRLTQLSQAELHDELHSSRECIEDRLGRPCTSLAYPYGDHDDRVVRAAADAGYRIAFTVPDQLSLRGVLRWPRIGIYNNESALSFRAKISPEVRALRRTPVWSYAQAFRSLRPGHHRPPRT